MARPSRLTSGWLVIVCGIVHTLVGLALGWSEVVAIARDGVANAVYQADVAKLSSMGFADWAQAFANQGGSRPRVFWFLWTGLAWISLGTLCHWIEHTLERPLPRFVGIGLLIYAVVGLILVPVSGFAVLTATAIVLVYRSRAGGSQE